MPSSPTSSTAANAEALDYLLGILSAAPPFPAVVVIGDRSRTWFVDCEYLGEILAAMASVRPDAVIRHSGKLPFDDLTERCAAQLGLAAELWGPVEREARLEPYDRDPGMVQGACCVVALPREGQGPEAADFVVVAAAAELGVPVLGFARL